MATYKEGSAEEEAGESKDEAMKEGDMSGAVKVPEAFQKSSHSLIQSATKAELEYLRSCIQERESTLRKSESKNSKAGTFDVEGMPS